MLKTINQTINSKLSLQKGGPGSGRYPKGTFEHEKEQAESREARRAAVTDPGKIATRQEARRRLMGMIDRKQERLGMKPYFKFVQDRFDRIKKWTEEAWEASAEARRKKGEAEGYKDRVAQRAKRNVEGEHKHFQEGYHRGYHQRDVEETDFSVD